MGRRGDEMGRHSAAVEVAGPQGGPDYLWADRWLADLVRDRWQKSTPKVRLQVGACLALPVVGLAIAAAASSSTPAESPTASVSQAGAAYGDRMRSEGYNGMSIELWCESTSGGYSGAQMQAYQSACFDVGMTLSQNGG